MKNESKQTDISTSTPIIPILTMQGITKRFPGVLANDRVDLELFPGEVLALLGENGAGKSTLMNILAGLYRPDEGRITIHGKEVSIESPQDSTAHGIGMVHQEFMLVDTMTVAENVILGLRGLPFIPKLDDIKKRIKELSDQYNLQVDPDSYIWQLGVGEQQRVEILKIIYRGADILILDEPTAVLTPQESYELNVVIKQMISEGKSAIFITHKMDEVLSFSNWVRILRNGRLVAVKKTNETSPKDLAKLMVGREVLFRLNKKQVEVGDVLLKIEDVRALNAHQLPALKGVSLEIRSGEVLGIAGVAGNGQKELAEVVTGLLPVISGKIFINGKDKTNMSPLDYIKSGVSHIPADRGSMGIIGDMSVANNLAMKGYRYEPILKIGILNPRRILDFAKRMIKRFNISTPTPHIMVKFLSGGNIQKTILAREIEACKGILIAAYPSRGLDVGATESVRNEILKQREDGTAVLLISEELEELLTIADKIAVIHEGEIMGIVASKETDMNTLGLMMTGVKNEETSRSLS